MSSKIYQKLYTKTITLPIIPYEGITNNETEYYALLEKNYVPVVSKENFTNPDWLTVSLTPKDLYYNLLKIVSAKPNNTISIRKYLMEFTVDKSYITNALSPCNSIYALFIQAPKEDISAYITFEILNEYQTVNGNTLTINGDEQYVKIIYYGIKVSNGLEMRIISNVSLTMNGLPLNSNNIISSRITGNGIEVIYLFNENSTNTKTYNLQCTYKGEYKSVTYNASIILKNNSYNLKLGINNISTTSSIINANKQNITFIYYCIYNGEYVTNNVNLKFSNITDKAVILYKNVSTVIENNMIKTTIEVESNLTNINRYIEAYVTYSSGKSNSVSLTLNASNINIILESLTTDILIISGTTGNIIKNEGGICKIKYYASTEDDMIISMSNNINGSTKTDNLTYTNNSLNFKVTSDNTYTNYKELTINIPANDSNTDIQYKITFTLGNISKTLTMTLNSAITSINVVEPLSYIIYGLMSLSSNDIIIKYNGELNGKITSDPNDVTIELYNNATSIYLSSITTANDYIIATYKHSENYGANANKYGDITVRDIIFAIKYKSTVKYVTYKLYPVYFGSSISTLDNTYTISSGATSKNIKYYGIIYNSEYDLNNSVPVPITSEDTYSNLTISNNNFTSLISKTHYTSYSVANVLFLKNITGSDRYITVKVMYKNIISSINIYQTTASINTRFYILSINNVNTYLTDITTYSFNPFLENDFVLIAENYTDSELLSITDGETFSDNIKNNNGYILLLSPNFIYTYSHYILSNKWVIPVHISTTYLTGAFNLNIIYDLIIGDYKSENNTITFNKENTDIILDITFNNEIIPENSVEVNISNNIQKNINITFIITWVCGMYEFIDTDITHYTITYDGGLYSNLSDVTLNENDNIFSCQIDNIPENTTDSVVTRLLTITYNFNTDIKKEIQIKLGAATFNGILSFSNTEKIEEKEIDFNTLDIELYLTIERNGINFVNNSIINTNIMTLLYDDTPTSISNISFTNINTYILVKFTVGDNFTITLLEINNIKVEYNIGGSNYIETDNSVKIILSSPEDNLLVVLEATPETFVSTGGPLNVKYYLILTNSGHTSSDGSNLILNISPSLAIYYYLYLNSEDNTLTYKLREYILGRNTGVGVRKLVLLAEYNGLLSNEKTITLDIDDTNVYISVTPETLPASGGIATVTYYGILNGNNVVDDDVLSNSLSDYKTYNLINRNKTIDSIIDTYEVSENKTTSMGRIIFTASYGNAISNCKLYIEANSFDCILLSDKILVDLLGDTIIFTYYGLKTDVTQINDPSYVTLICNVSSITIPSPILNDDGTLTCSITFPNNISGNLNTYIFTALYLYDGVNKVNSPNIILTLDSVIFTVNISSNYEILPAEIEDTLVITYYAEDYNGTHYYDPNMLTLIINEVDGYNAFGYMLLSSEIDDTNKCLINTYIIDNNDDTENELKLMFTALINSYSNNITVTLSAKVELTYKPVFLIKIDD